jgi:hypothetical protein
VFDRHDECPALLALNRVPSNAMEPTAPER